MMADVDFRELDGFQMPSRARGIGEWLERKEESQYEALFAALGKRNAHRKRRSNPQLWAHEYIGVTLRRRADRLARALLRPPCPTCGGAVSRGAKVPRGRKLPTYCSHRCMRSAVEKRYRESHPLRKRRPYAGKGAFRCGACGVKGHTVRTCKRAGSSACEGVLR